MGRLLHRLFPIEREELRPTLASALACFCLFASYYILKPLRDEIGAHHAQKLERLWTATFVAVLVAAPLYSALVVRFARVRLLSIVYRAFAACILGFYVLLVATERGPWVEYAFYVFAAVYFMYVASVFWQLMADLHPSREAKRLFGPIMVGASLGGLAGSAATGWLAGSERDLVAATIEPVHLLLGSVVLLEAAVQGVRIARSAAGAPAARPGPADRARLEDERVGGGVLTGIRAVFGSPYLLGVSLYLFLLTYCNTVLYFEQSYIFQEAFTSREERTASLAWVDFAVNALTAVLQLVVVGRAMLRLGVGIVLAAVPVLAAVGFAGLGAAPTLAMVVAFQVLYRSGRYGVSKPSREVLFTVVTREEKYKSKGFIDTVVYRGGDLATAWVFSGLEKALSVGAIALATVPVAAIWGALGIYLGRRHDERAAPREISAEKAS